jgi:UDP-glucuronate 4-epimerase
MKGALDGVGAVLHLAARPGVRPSFDDPDAYFEMNASATRDLLGFVRDASVERFVFASSSSVYGDGAAAPFREDGELGTPLSPYAESKRRAEEICTAAHGDVAVTIVRIFTAYGPRQRPDLAISRFARLILEDQPLPLYDEGRGRRDFTYVGDLVSGLVACLDLSTELHVLNLGSGTPIDVGTVVTELERALGRDARVELLPPARGDMPMTHADIERAGRLLDYAPSTSFLAGIDLFVEWLLNERSTR